MLKNCRFIFFIRILIGLFSVFSYANAVDFVTDKLVHEGTISEFLNGVVQPSFFSTPPQPNNLSSDLLVKKLREILRNRLVSTNYDRVHVVLQLLDHYNSSCKNDVFISPIEALKDFKYDHFLKNNRGAPCVGLTYDIFYHIPNDINAYIVAAELPQRYQQFAAPQYCHTAVLVPFKTDSEEGYILLDPSFDFSEPIVVKENDCPYFYDMGSKGVWVFFLENEKIICQISSSKTTAWTEEEIKNKRMVYRTDALMNPIESSAVPMALIDRRLSLLSRQEDGIQISHLNIELNKNQIVWDQNGVRFEPITFDDFLNGKFRFDESFAAGLYMEADELNQIILRVLNEKEILDQFYLGYLKLILVTEDWSITSPLDKKEISSIIKNFSKGNNID